MINQLVTQAISARNNSYAPYSGFTVGAALLCEDGSIYTGCNIENAAYGATNCAERTAVFKAISEGKLKFKAIAIAGGKKGQAPDNYAYPCGTCRQVLGEFCDSDFQIITVMTNTKYEIHTLSELLPYGFGKGNLS